MAQIEIYEDAGNDLERLLFTGEFDFVPRPGEHVSKEMGDYFDYYRVVRIWHREEGESGRFRTCLMVELDD